MTGLPYIMRQRHRRKVIEANLLGGATVGQIAAALGEPAEMTAATVLEVVDAWRKEWMALGDTQTEIDLRRVDLAINALWSTKAVQSGDVQAISQVLKLMELRNELLDKIHAEPFPAGERVPGQAKSRSAYREFQRLGDRLPWWGDYVEIRQRLVERKAAGQIERADWRVAAYIAWASSPVIGRWPETEQELAPEVLGLKSARTIRKWKAQFPWIDEEIAYWQAAPLMRHRRDAFEALVEGATTKYDPRYFQYTRLYLEMTGDYSPKGSLDVRANAALMDLPVGDLSDEELDAILENFLIAEKHERGSGRETGDDAGSGSSGDGAGRREEGDD
jgi:hypothetical protein